LRPLLLSVAIALLGLLLAGCGGARSPGRAVGKAVATRSSSSVDTPGAETVPHYAGVPRYPYDDDADNDGNADENIPTFGHEASTADRREMVATLKRYYAIAARREGSHACALFTSGFRRTVPVDYGRYGPSFEHGSTCAAVMSKVLDHYHRELLTEARRMKVIDARLEGEKGYVVVRPHSPCVRDMCVLDTPELLIAKLFMQREGGSWKVESLFLKV
jgi:hypothetical protein